VPTAHNHEACRGLLDQLSDYIDGELDEALCADLESHLADCSNCRVMVDTVRKTITLYHDQTPAELPSDVEDRLYSVLKLER
jgi:anti-sigma factor RsiW